MMLNRRAGKHYSDVAVYHALGKTIGVGLLAADIVQALNKMKPEPGTGVPRLNVGSFTRNPLATDAILVLLKKAIPKSPIIAGIMLPRTAEKILTALDVQKTGGHFILVDRSYTGPDGKTTFCICDPSGGVYNGISQTDSKGIFYIYKNMRFYFNGNFIRVT